MAGQEVPQQLYELAQQDSRFRQGSSRHKGGRGGGRRKGQVGGAGLGFSSGPPAMPGMPSSTAGGLPGFARAASGDGPLGGGTPAPPIAGSRPMAGFAAASTPAVPAAPAGPLPPPPPGPVPASATGPPPPPQQQAASSSGRSDGLDMVKLIHMQRFSKSFVSAGATQGDIGQVATVVMPKVRIALHCTRAWLACMSLASCCGSSCRWPFPWLRACMVALEGVARQNLMHSACRPCRPCMASRHTVVSSSHNEAMHTVYHVPLTSPPPAAPPAGVHQPCHSAPASAGHTAAAVPAAGGH
jgi:hypothetical protein